MLCYVGLLWAYACLKDVSSEIGDLGKQVAADLDGLDWWAQSCLEMRQEKRS